LGEHRRGDDEELAAGRGERPHGAIAVVLGEERGRTSGRVIAGRGFHLEQSHAADGGKEVTGAGPRHPATDDKKVTHAGNRSYCANNGKYVYIALKGRFSV